MRRRIKGRRVAMVLIALQALMLCAVLRRSYFREDDFWFLASFAEQPFWSVVFRNYAGHLMPGQLLIVALVQWISPLNFTVVVAALVALQCAAGAMVWRLLRELVGTTWAAITGLVVFLFCPLAIVSFVWYAGALQVLPLQLAVAGVLLHHVRFVRSRRTREAVLACVWLVMGLFFWEKALVSLLLAAMLTLWWFPVGSGIRGAFAAFRRDRRLWAGYLAIVGVYLVGYLALTTQVASPRPGSATYVKSIWRALTGGAVPYLLGGPFSSAARSATSMVEVTHGALYLLVFACIVLATVVRRRAAWRAWAMLAVYLVVNAVVITSARGGYFGALIGLLPRYFGDLTLATAIAVPLALAPLRSTAADAGPATLEVGRRAIAWSGIGVAYAVMGFVTSSYAAGGMAGDDIRAFVGNARRDLASLGDVVVIDGPTPSWVNALGTSRQVLLGMGLPVRFEEPGDRIYTLELDGHLRPSTLVPVAAGQVAPGACGTRIDDGTRVRVTLDPPLLAARRVIRLDYSIASDAALAVVAGGVRHDTVVTAGDHQLFVPVREGMRHIDVGLLGGTASMCLTDVGVGVVELPR